MVQENSGNVVPGCRVARCGSTRDPTLLGCVAPVLGRYASARGDVVGERDVPGRIDVERRGVHALVDDDAAVFGVEAGRRCEPDVGAHPGGGDDEFALDRLTGVQEHSSVLDRGHGGRPDEANTDVGQHLCDALADLDPNLRCRGTGSGATSVVSMPRVARLEAASQPIRPPPTTTADSACTATIRRMTASAKERRLSAASPPGTLSGTAVEPQARTRCQ